MADIYVTVLTAFALRGVNFCSQGCVERQLLPVDPTEKRAWSSASSRPIGRESFL